MIARVAWLVVVLVAIVPRAARAQEASEPSVELFDRGVERLREGDHAAAVEAFRESYRLAPRVTTMCNLALTYDRWSPEHRVQAVRAYRTCARDDDTGRFREFAERRVAEIERELVLEGDETEAGAEVEAGTEVDADAEAETDEDAEIPTPPPSEPGHELLYAGIATGGVAVGALIAGVVIALDAQSQVDALEEELGSPPTVVRGSPEHQRLEDARTTAAIATGLYVGAAVLGALGATLITIDLTTTAGEATVALTPTGASLSARF